MSNRDLLERIARQVPPPGFSDLRERRDRKLRRARFAAATSALGLTALLFAGAVLGVRAFDHDAQPVGAAPTDPNGAIAFTVRESDGWHVGTVNADGSGRRILTAGVRDYGTSWSPDGTQIAYDTEGDTEGSGIWIMNADGTDERRLTTGTDMFPRWSPDGTQIAFSRWGEGMYKADRYTSYATDYLWVINVDGTQERQLTRGEFSDVAGSWSPDGRMIAFLRSSGDGSGIWVVDSNGEGAHEVVSLGFQLDGTPSWSPDGTQLLFVNLGTIGSGADPRIWVVNADGTEAHVLLDAWANDPTWSPDGMKIAYTSDGDIWVMNADGTDPRRVTTSPDEEIQPSWGVAPDSAGTSGVSEIVKVSGEDALRDPSAVERMLRDSGIDADVLEVPLPSTPDGYWNGVWWWLYFDGPAALTEEEFAVLQAQVGVGVVGTQPDADNTTVLELPKGLPGHVTLLVGREVAPGAFNVFEYDRFNELAPTGAFYCLGLDPRDPAALGQALVQRGYRVIWNYEDLAHNVGREVAAPPEGTVATWAWFRGPKLVDVRIVDDGPDAKTYREAEGTFVPGETPPWAPSCS